MKIERKYQGFTTTSKYLTVHWEERVGGSVRFCSLQVPLDVLWQAEDVLCDAMDRSVRRRLISLWSDQDVPLS